jgi:hypothetical protein
MWSLAHLKWGELALVGDLDKNGVKVAATSLCGKRKARPWAIKASGVVPQNFHMKMSQLAGKPHLGQ